MKASLRNALFSTASLAILTGALVGCGNEPTPGRWDYHETSVGKNTCNYDGVVSNGGGYFQLVADGDGYTIEPGDGTAAFSCTLDGDELDCPDRAAVEQELSGLDAKLVIKVTANVTVENSARMVGTQHGTVSCEGSGCGAAAASVGASLPCEFEVDFEAEFDED